MTPIFCPVCKRINESSATVCEFCNASLNINPEDQPSTARVQGDTNILSPALEAEYIRKLDTPEHGLGIYIDDFTKSIVIQAGPEFILGRLKPDTTLADLIDLAPYGGYEDGVSQRHAMIRKTDSGYEIIDLASTNGTWLEGKRMTPNQPYPFDSGAQIHLGRLRLLIVYK